MNKLTILDEILNDILVKASKIHEALSKRDIKDATEVYSIMKDLISCSEWDVSKYPQDLGLIMKKIDDNINDKGPLYGLLYNQPNNLNEKANKILNDIIQDVRSCKKTISNYKRSS